MICSFPLIHMPYVACYYCSYLLCVALSSFMKYFVASKLVCALYSQASKILCAIPPSSLPSFSFRSGLRIDHDLNLYNLGFNVCNV